MNLQMSLPFNVIRQWYQLLGSKSLVKYQCQGINGHKAIAFAAFSEFCLTLTITNEKEKSSNDACSNNGISLESCSTKVSFLHNFTSEPNFENQSCRKNVDVSSNPTISCIAPYFGPPCFATHSEERSTYTPNTATILEILSAETEQCDIIQANGEQIGVLIPCEPVICNPTLQVKQQVNVHFDASCDDSDICQIPNDCIDCDLSNEFITRDISDVHNGKIARIKTTTSSDAVSEFVNKAINDPNPRIKTCLAECSSKKKTNVHFYSNARRENSILSGTANKKAKHKNISVASSIRNSDHLLLRVAEKSPGSEKPKSMNISAEPSVIMDEKGKPESFDCGPEIARIIQGNCEICKFCGKQFSKTNVKEHTQTCKDNPERVCYFYCTCNFKSQNIHVVNEHKKTCKKKISNLSCNECGKEFQSRGGLSQHRRSIHKVSKNPSKPVVEYKCKICGKDGFFRKSLLVRHQNKHTDIRDFVCETCGNSYKKLHHLRQHVNSMHKNIFPYRCEKCGHGVKNKKGLEKHGCGRVRRPQTCERVSSASEHTSDLIT